MDCIIYTRFSPRRNEEGCASTDVQLAYCRKFAEQKGWTVKAVFSDEAVSGTVEIEDRRLHDAISEIKKGDVLLAHKRDRLSRDLMIGLQIERVVESRGGVVAVAEGEPFGNDPNARMMKHMLMVVAEWERAVISDRTRKSMRMQQANGKRVSHIPPFGYMIDPEAPGRLIENPKEMETLNLIWDLHRKGHATNEIAQKILKPEMSRNGVWHTSTVQNVIKRLEATRA